MGSKSFRKKTSTFTDNIIVDSANSGNGSAAILWIPIRISRAIRRKNKERKRRKRMLFTQSYSSTSTSLD